MKALRNIVFLIIAALVISGCASLRPVKETVVYDTLRIESQVVIRDTILFSDTAVVMDTFEVPCPEMKLNISKQSGHAQLKVNIKSGKGTVECFCDSTKIIAQIRDKYEKQFQNRTEIQTKIITKKQSSAWMKFLAISGAIFWILLLIIIIIQIKKIIP